MLPIEGSIIPADFISRTVEKRPLTYQHRILIVRPTVTVLSPRNWWQNTSMNEPVSAVRSPTQRRRA